MITVRVGDLFESKAQTIVNTVNCVGVMGKGIALEFKKRFPDMYEDYERRCQAHEVKLGEPYLFRRLLPPWILNFPTKGHWRAVSHLSDIVRGLEYLERHYREWGIESLAVPPLGCGHGGLEWRAVGPTMHRHLSRFGIPVELFAPHGTPGAQLELRFLAVQRPAPAERIPAGLFALVTILARIEREPYHWPVGRVGFQKIAYFATAAGIPTGLHYERGSYGPFSRELKAAYTKLVNHGLLVERSLGRMFEVSPGAAFADATPAYGDELEKWGREIDRVSDLFLRMSTTDAEIAATVRFAAAKLAASLGERGSEQQVLEAVRDWKQKRRPPLNDEEVARSIRTLNLLGWVHLSPSRGLPGDLDQQLDV
jgi:O-acetyl-ADP-ribose deacetylase (regulator of RNase III)